MSAFNDIICPKCHKRFGWAGKLTDCPPCPKCGHQIDFTEDQKHIDEFEKLLAARKTID